MKSNSPIKEKEIINKMKDLFLKKGQIRGYLLFSLAINTGINLKELLELKVKDVKNKNVLTLGEDKVVLLSKDLQKAIDDLIAFYHINESFLPEKSFSEDSYILYTNYFGICAAIGICAANVKKLSNKYKNLIVDNAQAYYMPRYGLASFNSARKFMGVPDGAFLRCEKLLDEPLELDKSSIVRFSHLLKRVDTNALDDKELYLLSDKAKYITGADFVINGGLVI